jgi:hypothetical protein
MSVLFLYWLAEVRSLRATSEWCITDAAGKQVARRKGKKSGAFPKMTVKPHARVGWNPERLIFPGFPPALV